MLYFLTYPNHGWLCLTQNWSLNPAKRLLPIPHALNRWEELCFCWYFRSLPFRRGCFDLFTITFSHHNLFLILPFLSSFFLITFSCYYLNSPLSLLISTFSRQNFITLPFVFFFSHHYLFLSLPFLVITFTHHYLFSSLPFLVISFSHYLFLSLPFFVITFTHHYIFSLHFLLLHFSSLLFLISTFSRHYVFSWIFLITFSCYFIFSLPFLISTYSRQYMFSLPLLFYFLITISRQYFFSSVYFLVITFSHYYLFSS